MMHVDITMVEQLAFKLDCDAFYYIITRPMRCGSRWTGGRSVEQRPADDHRVRGIP